MKDLFDYKKYLFLLPHADDEVYCSTLISRLLKERKEVLIILVTNGDAGVNPELRKEEMQNSIHELGYPLDKFIQLDVSEKHLMPSYKEVFNKVKKIIDTELPDCVVTVDYEGGHEGHDSINFIMHKAIEKHESIIHLTYPAYHYEDMHRVGLYFLPGRSVDFELPLKEADVDLKIKLLEAHRGQIGFFLRVQKYQDDYFTLLFSREQYRVMDKDFDYFTRPAEQMGYEYHRNGYKFEDFLKSAAELNQNLSSAI